MFAVYSCLLSRTPGVFPVMDKETALILQKAVEFDQKNRFTEALISYRKGSQMLLDVVKG